MTPVQKEYQLSLDHLVKMSRNPGFKDHAWHRAKELDVMPGYVGIKDELVKRMKEEKK